MKRFLIFFVILLAIGSSTIVKGQDIHYSQFYNSPLTLNPAMTGRINGDFRINLNYRNQWLGVADDHSTYVTPSLSFDMPLPVFKNDAVGVGIMVMNDQSSGGKLSNITTMLSGSYHKSVGENHHVSLGVQAGYVQRQLDHQDLTFSNQIGEDYEFDESLPSGEAIEDNTIRYMDMQLGLMWTSSFGENLSAYAGGAMFHVTAPEKAFAKGTELNLPRRWVGHGGLDIGVSEKIDLLPSVIYMNQNKAREINAGLSGAYKISDKTNFYLGGYYRVQDAAIIYSAIEWNDVKLGISYDATVSELQNSGGSLEFSLTYVRRTPDVPDVKPKMYCPRF